MPITLYLGTEEKVKQNKEFWCGWCGQEFYSEDDLIVHLHKKHGDYQGRRFNRGKSELRFVLISKLPTEKVQRKIKRNQKHITTNEDLGKFNYIKVGENKKGIIQWQSESARSELYQKQKEYHKTPKGKEVQGKANSKAHAKRKWNLGFEPLNSWFPGSEGHHVDMVRVIYIPKKLHRSIYHNLNTGKGMEEINKLAFEFLEKEK